MKNPLKEFEHALLIERVASRYCQAMEFDTEEARAKYLKDHPGADKSLHTVKKEKLSGGKEEKTPSGKKPKLTPEQSKLYNSMPDENLVGSKLYGNPAIENHAISQFRKVKKGDLSLEDLQKEKKELDTKSEGMKASKDTKDLSVARRLHYMAVAYEMAITFAKDYSTEAEFNEAYEKNKSEGKSKQASVGMTYEQALKEAEKVGAGRAEGLPLLAQQVWALSRIHRGINPKAVYEGAVKQGLTAKDLRKMKPVEIGDLMFV